MDRCVKLNKMDKLKKILLPTATKERITETKQKIKEIESSLDSGGNVEQLIDRFNEFTGKKYEEYDFQNYWRSEDLETFANDAAQPVPKKIDDIKREELIEILNRIINADKNTKFYLELLDRNLPHPRISDLMIKCSGNINTALIIIITRVHYRLKTTGRTGKLAG